MRNLWFHLMPYKDLPATFKQDHNSIWVDIDPRLLTPEKVHEYYNEYMDELEYAAECGFDAICVNEHHGNAYGLMPSPNLIAATLARRTSNAAICVMGASLALYNPPTRVAEEFAMLDCISGGRLIAGFPVGTPMDTCYVYGQNPSTLRQRYLEAHDLIIKAWAAEEAFAYNGRFNQQRYVNVWPRPVQKPHPPIWVPGGGSVETWAWCGEMDYVYSYVSYYGHVAAEATMMGFWEEMARQGKDRNPFRAGFLQFVGVAETREEAIRLYREPAEFFYSNCLHVDPSYVMPPGYVSEATQRMKMKSQVQAAADRSSILSSVKNEMEGILAEGYVLIGSPDEVADQLRKIARKFNVGNLLTLLQFGNMDRQLANYNTKLFAEKVMPQIRDLFEDEWEHKWWPKPMGQAARAMPRTLMAAE
ncbi:LLM class flavin-dependent oxidoreductase [Phenylobacterium sp.]|uniref:LLM class flavin-dependent oxidoreductase n=1 Tax=Phenylobacterium sp. TaxID=1871053 RepID=UPI0025F4DFD3|nr:LLM class flavin-dependent oxidoreductase [Phenylobacterium sp.]